MTMNSTIFMRGYTEHQKVDKGYRDSASARYSGRDSSTKEIAEKKTAQMSQQHKRGSRKETAAAKRQRQQRDSGSKETAAEITQLHKRDSRRETVSRRESAGVSRRNS